MSDGKGNGEAPNRLRPFFRHVSDLVVRAPDWLVHGVIERDSLMLLFGDSDTGKSLLSIDLAACIASGIPWRGHEVEQPGPVLYVAGEGQGGLARRFRAWQLHNGVNLADVPLYVSTVPTELTEAREQMYLRHIIDKHANEVGSPAFVVLDTLARNFGPGDENSTQDMGNAVNACDSLRRLTGATVCVVHHTGHGDKNRARGAYALHAGVDCEYRLTRAENVLTLECQKMKDGIPPKPVSFKPHGVKLDTFDNQGQAVSSAVLVTTEYTPPAEPAPKKGTGSNQKRALQILVDRYTKQRANVAASGRDEGQALVAMDTWRDLCAAEGINRHRFAEVSRSLQTLGFVAIAYGNVTLVDRKSHA